MYLTYDEYKEMGGTLEEAEFNDLERESRTYVDDITFNRFRKDKEYPKELKECMYILIDKVKTLGRTLKVSVDPDETPQIVSQSNDGVSISYNVLSAIDIQAQAEKDIQKTLRAYLFGVRNEAGRLVTYRGVYPDE